MHRHRFPKRIHQTWKDDQVPEIWRPVAESWKRYLPDWDYRLWTDRDNRQLVAEHYPWLLETYDGYPENIMRADAARYCILHRYGGVYADLDYECLRRFDDVLAGRELVAGLEPSDHVSSWAHERGSEHIVGNAFMASVPGHPLLSHLLRKVVVSRDLPTPVEATGPFLLTRALHERPERTTLLDSDWVYPLTKDECWAAADELDSLRGGIAPEALGVHYWDGSWWRHPDQLRGSLGRPSVAKLEFNSLKSPAG